MKRVITTALALACFLAPPRLVSAQDNSTEFGVADDLSIFGVQGSAVDPDAEIKGFTVFGATQAAYPGALPVAAGNVVVNGLLSVSSGAYFTGGSTFSATGGAYFLGVSSFAGGPGSIHIQGGTADYVLKKDITTGGLKWAVDMNDGSSGLTGAQYRLVRFKAGGGAEESGFLENAGGTAITLLGTSSMTILGNGTDGLGVAGATKLTGTLSVGGQTDLSGKTAVIGQPFTVTSGSTTLGGGLSVADSSTFSVVGGGGAHFRSSATFAAASAVFVPGGVTDQVLAKDAGGGLKWRAVSGDDLGNHVATTTLNMATKDIINAGRVFAGSMTVTGSVTASSVTVTGDTLLNGAVYLGAAATKSTFTTTGQLTIATGQDIVLVGAGSQVTLPNAPSAGTDAANKDYVDLLANGVNAVWQYVPAQNDVKLSTLTASVGIGVADPTAKLHVSSANASATDILVKVSSGTGVGQDIFQVEANGEVSVKNSLAVGRTYAFTSPGTSNMIVEGTVGVGATAPDANTKMQVVGGAASNDFVSKFYSGASLAAWIKKK